MNWKEKKPEILYYITYTVVLVFLFVHIKTIINWLQYIIQLLMPFIVGAMIAFVLNVLLNLVENKLFAKWNHSNSKRWQRVKRPLCLIVTLLIVFFLFFFILGLVIPELKNTATIFVENIPEYSEDAGNFLSNLGVGEETIEQFRETMSTLEEDVSNYIKDHSNQILNTTLGFATTLISSITNLVIGIVFAIYILLQKEKLSSQCKKIMRAYCKPKHQEKLEKISELSRKTFSNFVSGQCVEAFIIGILCFLGMLLLRIPYAPTISVLVGFTALIPVFGAFIGTAIGMFLIFMVDPMKSLIFLIFIIILQQLEGNLIYPKVVGKSVGLPGIWVMVAVTVGASLAGIAGMLISVPLCSILYSIFATDVKTRLAEQAQSRKRVEKTKNL